MIKIIIGVVLLIQIATVFAEDAAPTEKKVNISDSAVCKKCICNVETSLIDCTEKLQGWLSKEDWELLQSGDVIFDTIKLEHNNLTTVPILPLYGVKNLYLGFNQIESITIGAFQNLTLLEKLDLSHNKLTSKALVPDVFKGQYSAQDFVPMGSLKSLNLGYNELHSLNDDLFEHLPNLEELILCSNTFQVIDKLTETALAGLTALKTLDISYMEIKDLPETLLHSPRDLETLIAAGNLFLELPKTLSYAVNLKRLVLDENPIGNLDGKNIFPAMTNLKYLSLSYMPELYKIGKGALAGLQNLTELILSDDKMLIEIDEEALSVNRTGGQYLDYPPLEKLYLNNCNLTTLPRPLIFRWDNVKVIDLRFNPWVCDETNAWMINILMTQVNKNTPILADNVECAAPQELKGVTLLRVANEELIGNSSHGSFIWIGLLVSVLIIAPLAVAGFFVYKRGCFGLVNRNDSVARRTLYDRASFNEDFHI